MRIIFLLLLIIPFYSFGNDCGELDQRRCVVSVINLVATPERYNNKEVVVRGYIYIGRGGAWLSLFSGRFDSASMVYIDISEDLVNKMALNDQDFYTVAGIFEYCGSKQTITKECYNSIIPIVGENGEPIIVSIKP
ncbi:hypothetical protein MN202_20375 [Rheinheimera muenzenbergensis]|uniref:Tissue inhibitor of metalloproteinase n=1 Tax=Rheinheimera muenzenbergensis TaxID=1193628 RepID=A0ABU8CD42_9GAMM